MSVLDLAARHRGDPTLADWTPIPRVWENCIIPTYDGSGITTHPSIVDMGRKWNGYRWWQANTPFAGDDIKLENPSIWGSNDRWHWEVPKGLQNPLIKAPDAGTGYNSDTELVWDHDNQRMVCIYREVVTGATTMRSFWSANGSSWYQGANLLPGAMGSPAIEYIGPGDWRMWSFGTAGPYMYSAPALLGPWTSMGACTINGADATTLWHGDIIRYKDRWIGVYGRDGDRKCIPMACSDDGITWTADPTAAMGNAYRPTLIPSTVPDHIDVWTGTAKQYYNRWHISMWPAVTAVNIPIPSK